MRAVHDALPAFSCKTGTQKGRVTIHRLRWFPVKMTISTYLSHYPAASVPSINNRARPMAELSKWSLSLVMNTVGFHKVWSRHWQNHPGLLAPRERPVADIFVNRGTDSSAFSTCTWLFPLEQKVNWKDCRGFMKPCRYLNQTNDTQHRVLPLLLLWGDKLALGHLPPSRGFSAPDSGNILQCAKKIF